MLKVLSSILCDLDPKVKAIGQKAGICDGVPSTSALVGLLFEWPLQIGFTVFIKHFLNISVFMSFVNHNL